MVGSFQPFPTLPLPVLPLSFMHEVMDAPLDLLTDLINTARKAGATASDALWYEATSLNVSRRMGKPEGLERSESGGIGLRVFVGQRTATASSSDTGADALRIMVERAVAMAKLAPEDPYVGLALDNRLATQVPDLDLYDAYEPETVWLQEQCAQAEDAALAVTGITNSEGAEAAYSASRFALATSHGFAHSYKASHVSLSVSVLAGEGTEMERDYDMTSVRFSGDMEKPESVGRSAAARALARLHPRKISTQAVPLVFDPRVSRRLVGIFASAINGSSVARGTSFLKDSMGTSLFPASVAIVDDPFRPRGLGSRPLMVKAWQGRRGNL